MQSNVVPTAWLASDQAEPRCHPRAQSVHPTHLEQLLQLVNACFTDAVLVQGQQLQGATSTTSLGLCQTARNSQCTSTRDLVAAQVHALCTRQQQPHKRASRLARLAPPACKSVCRGMMHGRQQQSCRCGAQAVARECPMALKTLCTATSSLSDLQCWQCCQATRQCDGSLVLQLVLTQVQSAGAQHSTACRLRHIPT